MKKTIANNTVEELRSALFECIDRIKTAPPSELDKEIKKSDAMIRISETIINSAKVENEFIVITKSEGSGFFLLPPNSQ